MPSTRQQVIDRDGHVCRYCARTVFPKASPDAPDRPDDLTLDHVVPRRRRGPAYDRGPSTAGNLVVACRACNHAKGEQPLAQWRPDLAGFFPGLPPGELPVARKRVKYDRVQNITSIRLIARRDWLTDNADSWGAADDGLFRARELEAIVAELARRGWGERRVA